MYTELRIDMENRYDNGQFVVVANPYENCYYVVNTETGITESRETVESTAKFKCDAYRDVAIKHRKQADMVAASKEGTLE